MRDALETLDEVKERGGVVYAGSGGGLCPKRGDPRGALGPSPRPAVNVRRGVGEFLTARNLGSSPPPKPDDGGEQANRAKPPVRLR